MDIARQNVAAVFDIRVAINLIRGLRRKASQNRRFDCVGAIIDNCFLTLEKGVLTVAVRTLKLQGYEVYCVDPEKTLKGFRVVIGLLYFMIHYIT